MDGRIEVGRIYGDRKRFAAVHRDTPRGLRVVLDDAHFDGWIVGRANPESVAARLRA
ncbi:MAG TPA: hypothetical protein VFX16_02170 [Pseudonocardiaceae bacterium]|nr:hypothetical protein [Pseudonocardiaceae bacterium]